MRAGFAIAGTAVLAVLAAGASGLSGFGADEARAGPDSNPCGGGSPDLLCPDLEMSPPFDVHVDRDGKRRLLRAGNSIDSVGDGPAELRGKRSGKRTMDARQRIYEEGGGRTQFETGAELYFKRIPGQGRYWKFRHAAAFELWRLDKDTGERVGAEPEKTGPKKVYCLRDLKHTAPGPGSPDNRVYPACNQDPDRERETIGTSVGWSDQYPASYHEQWINVANIDSGGCFAYVHIADPKNGIHELEEGNNESSTLVGLNARGGHRQHRCEGVPGDVDLGGAGGGGGGY